MEEKRKVHTDALETLGHIIGETEKRDAIHLAVNPTVAKEKLLPGQDVGVDGTINNPVGIVDPFLKTSVNIGERFWLVIYPRQIHSLRHVWTHPSFPEENEINDVDKSIKWMENFAKNIRYIKYHDVLPESTIEIGIDYKTLMGLAYTWLGGEGGFSTIYNGFDTQDIESEHDEDIEEFWFHYEIITGKKVDEPQKIDFFGCCC